MEEKLKKIEVSLKKLNEAISIEDKLKQGKMLSDQQIIAKYIFLYLFLNLERKNLEGTYERKKAELIKLKEECINNEDYNGMDFSLKASF